MTPPQNIECEEAILGAMMCSQFAREATIELGLRSDHFYRPSHRTIFEAIRAIEDQAHIDEKIVLAKLRATKGKDGVGNDTTALDAVGGTIAILGIAERVPAVANARGYAIEVIRQATLRMLVETGIEIARLGHEPDADPKTLVDRAGHLVSLIQTGITSEDFVTLDEVCGPLIDELQARAESGVTPGLSTGFPGLDGPIGGLQGGRLYIVAARPGMGKSSFAMNVIEAVGLEGHNVAMFSLEMDAKQLTTRVLSGMGRVSNRRLRNGIPLASDFEKLAVAMTTIATRAKNRIYIDQSRVMTPFVLAARARRLDRRLRRKGERLAAIFVDYLQLMEPDEKAENQNIAVGKYTKALFQLAGELDVPVVALAQLSRANEQRPDKRPQLSDLRDSGNIEQDANVVMFIHRPEYYLAEEKRAGSEFANLAEVIIAKNRDGETGSAWLGWDGTYTRFSPLENECQRREGGMHIPGARNI